MFFDGGRLFNTWTFYIGVGGIALALAGIGVAVWKAWKAASAAQAAQVASASTAREFRSLETMLDLAFLTRWCTEVVGAIQNADFAMALVRITDLQASLAQLAVTSTGEAIFTQRSWTDLRKKLKYVETTLATARRSPAGSVDAAAVASIEDEMRQVFYRVMELTQKARSATRIDHGTSREA